MMTQHSVMTSSLPIKILKIDKFCDFSCDINYNSRTDGFRDVMYLIINQCDPGTPAGTKCPPAGQRKQASALVKSIFNFLNNKYLFSNLLLFACLRCAASGHFVSARGSLRSPEVTSVNYKGDSISKYVQLSIKIDITRKITKFVNY